MMICPTCTKKLYIQSDFHTIQVATKHKMARISDRSKKILRNYVKRTSRVQSLKVF